MKRTHKLIVNAIRVTVFLAGRGRRGSRYSEWRSAVHCSRFRIFVSDPSNRAVDDGSLAQQSNRFPFGVVVGLVRTHGRGFFCTAYANAVAKVMDVARYPTEQRYRYAGSVESSNRGSSDSVTVDRRTNRRRTDRLVTLLSILDRTPFHRLVFRTPRR